MSNWFEDAAGLRDGEGRTALLGGAQFFLLMFAYFMLRPLREAMGLAGGVDELSTLFLINVGVMVVLNPLYGWLASRALKRKLTVYAYRGAMLCLGVFAFLLWGSGGEPDVLVGQVFYVWLSVFNVFLISLFWQLMADLETPEQSKRVFGVVAVGGTLGAIAGSLWAWGLVSTLKPFGMMLVSVALLELGARVSLMQRAGDRVRSAERIGGSAWAGLSAMARSPYLCAIGLYILLHTSVSTFVYFEKARIVDAASESTLDRAELFAQITLWGQVLTVMLQVFLTGRLLRWLGVGTLLCVVPFVSVGGFVALGLAGSVLTITIFEGVRNSTHYAMGRPARETLFTVLSTEDKYKAKAVLDTFVYRGGDAGSALVHRAVAQAGTPFVAVVAPLCAAAMALGLWLGRQEKKRERAFGATETTVGGSPQETPATA